MAYLRYEFSEYDTFSTIAIAFNMTVTDLLKINNITMPAPVRPADVPFLNGTVTIAEMPSGDNMKYGVYDEDVVLQAFPDASDFGVPKIFQADKLKATSQFTAHTVGESAIDKCWITIDNIRYYFPCYPESYSDNYSANISSVNVLGRSEPFQIYNNGGPRKVDVSFEIHREMYLRGRTYLDELVKALHSASFPKGDDSILPKVTFAIINKTGGYQCYIHGLIDGGASVQWKGPINEWGTYNMVSLSFSVIECRGIPRTSADVRNHGWDSPN